MQGILADWIDRYRYPLGIALASRALVYLLLALASWQTRLPDSRLSSFATWFSALGRFDASWYRWIALHGYDRAGAHGHHANVVAFSPLYPTAYRAVSAIPGPMTLWGSLLSTVLFTGALCALYDLGCRTVGAEKSRRTVVYLAFAPLSFVFSLPYSESLFLMLVVGAFMLTHAQRPWPAAVLSALAVLTRPVGIALLPALAWHATRTRKPARAYLPLLLPLGAQAGLVVYFAIHTGDPLAQLHAQHHGWHRSPSLLPIAFVRIAAHVIDSGDVADAINVAFTLLWAGLLVHAWRMRLPGEYLVYAALAILIPTSTGTLLSIGRFGLVAFPVFWALADIGRRSHIDAAIKLLLPALLTLVVMLVYVTTELSP
jgi:hypothetical protein